MSVFNGLRQGLADFRLMAEGVDNASQVPAISVRDGLHDFGSGGDGRGLENRVGEPARSLPLSEVPQPLSVSGLKFKCWGGLFEC